MAKGEEAQPPLGPTQLLVAVHLGLSIPASVKCQCLAQSVTGTSWETVVQREKTILFIATW